MQVSLSWLKDYVSVEMDVLSLADALTMAGLEVESVSDRYDYLNTVVAGRVVKIAPHPNSGKLTICEVDIGDSIITVVFGGNGIKKDVLYPVAIGGTLFPDGFFLEKSIIRGEMSEGMFCSEAQLGLGTNSTDIMHISQTLRVGESIAKALGLSDTVFDIDLTPNRPDCLSIIGVAREVATILKTKVRYPKLNLPDAFDHIADFSSVTVKAPDHCPRYAARLLMDIKVAPSPFWMQDHLMSVGVRPINNIVDITNYVMMETGQPLHAFDFDRIEEHRIVVRTANMGETFTTIDGKERQLSPDMLMICDGAKPVAIAGVMGGINSEIKETTTSVLIESAYFSPVSIRKTSKKLGLSTDASHRFERGADPEGTIPALNKAAQLMAETSGGRLIHGIIDEHAKMPCNKAIDLSVAETNRILGTAFTQGEIENLLKSIEFKVEKYAPNDPSDQDRLNIIPPSFRVDVKMPVDLMEEIARLSGYNNIPTTFPFITAETKQPEKQLISKDRLKNQMTGFGFTEVITYSFINKKSCGRLCIKDDDKKSRQLNIKNPLAEDQAVMRTSLIAGLLGLMRYNISQQTGNIKIFEVGKIFIDKLTDSLPEEIEMLAGLWTGKRFNTTWHDRKTECDLFDIKGVVEGLLKSLHVDNIVFTMMPEDMCSYTKPGYTAQILANNNPLGLVGEINQSVLDNFDLKQKAFIFELDINRLVELIPDIKQSQPVPKFPATSRDITIIVNKKIESSRILEEIGNADEDLVENLYLFDIFEGHPVPHDKKSISLRITYRSLFKTLEDDVINNIHKNITGRLLKSFDATLP